VVGGGRGRGGGVVSGQSLRLWGRGLEGLEKRRERRERKGGGARSGKGRMWEKQGGDGEGRTLARERYLRGVEIWEVSC